MNNSVDNSAAVTRAGAFYPEALGPVTEREAALLLLPLEAEAAPSHTRVKTKHLRRLVTP